MTEQYYDPRKDVEHPIEIGQVYVDSRHEHLSDDERAIYTIIYLDEHAVVMRSNKSPGREARDYLHRMEDKKTFKKMVGSGRYKLRPDMDAPVPVGNVTLLKERAEMYGEKDGRKSQHMAEAFREAVEIMTGVFNPDDDEPVDLEALDNIGEKAAANLREEGYVTRGDLRNASDEDLLDVPFIGEAGLESIREAV